MLTKLILPGEKIELQSMEKSILGSASDKKSYISRIYDVLSDDQFEVLMPMEQTKLILLPVDGEYDVCFYTKQGLYQCYVRSLQKGQYLYFTMRNNLQSEKTSEKRILSFLLHSQYEQQGTCRGRAFCDRTEQAVHSGRTSAQTECGGGYQRRRDSFCI